MFHCLIFSGQNPLLLVLNHKFLSCGQNNPCPPQFIDTPIGVEEALLSTEDKTSSLLYAVHLNTSFIVYMIMRRLNTHGITIIK